VHILLTGRPGVGKTTAVVRIAERLEGCGVRVAGFYTREIRERGKRLGFEVVTIPGGRTGILSHVDFKSPHRVSRYGVDVAAFEGLVLPIFDVQDAAVLIIDEIGPMELFSRKFERRVLAALGRVQPRIVGVVQEKRLGMVEGIKGVRICRIDARNRDRVPSEVLALLGYG